MRGHKRFRSGAWRLIVFAGFDPVFGKWLDSHETVRAPNTRAGRNHLRARTDAIRAVDKPG